MLFWSLVLWINVLITFSEYSLWLYRNAIDFYILILYDLIKCVYQFHEWKSVCVCSCVCMSVHVCGFLRIFYIQDYVICDWIETVLLFSFKYEYVYLSCLTALARKCSVILYRYLLRVDILFFSLKECCFGKTFSVSPFSILIVGVFVDTFY